MLGTFPASRRTLPSGRAIRRTGPSPIRAYPDRRPPEYPCLVERRLDALVERVGRLDPGRQLDVALAAGAALLNVVAALRPDPELAYDLRFGLLPALAGAIAGIALLWRRSHALAVFSLILLAAFASTVLHWQSGIPVTLFLAGYALGAYATLRAGGWGLALSGVLFGVLFWVRAPYFDSPLGLFAVAEVVVSWAVGFGVAHRRRLADLARERRRQLARDGAREAENAVLAERLRMARHLQAQVSTSLLEVTQQAASARRAGSAEPEILAGIERESRAAADDLRRMLGTLRDPAERPQPLPPAVPGPPDWPVDVALGLGVVVLNVGGSLLPETSSARQAAEPVLPVLLAMSVIPGLALMLRRRLPVTVLAVVLAVVVAVFWLDWPEGNLPAALVIATYALGAWAPVRRGAVTLIAMYATMITLPTLGPTSLSFEWTMLLIFTPPWIVGVALRRHRIRDRAAMAATLTAEAEHAAAIQRTLVDERLAVARDLHDVMSHNLSSIVIQVTAARRRADGPDEQLLKRVEESGREALAGLHQMVEALQSRATKQPAPGLPDLEALIAQHIDRHGPVDVAIDPAIANEPESIRVTTFRLVQEALTNVAKHAPGAPTSVAVLAVEDGVRVLVENELRQPPSVVTSSGIGLAGMRERVALFDGELDAGSDGRGTFVVQALLPRAVPS